MNIWLVSSAFTSGPILLPATGTASLYFFYSTYVLAPPSDISTAHQRLSHLWTSLCWLNRRQWNSRDMQHTSVMGDSYKRSVMKSQDHLEGNMKMNLINKAEMCWWDSSITEQGHMVRLCEHGCHTSRTFLDQMMYSHHLIELRHQTKYATARAMCVFQRNLHRSCLLTNTWTYVTSPFTIISAYPGPPAPPPKRETLHRRWTDGAIALTG